MFGNAKCISCKDILQQLYTRLLILVHTSADIHPLQIFGSEKRKIAMFRSQQNFREEYPGHEC